MRRRIAWAVGVAALVVFWRVLLIGMDWPRFVRQSWSGLDQTTAVDIIRDRVTGHCYAMYRVWGAYSSVAPATALISYVPCDGPMPPIPPMPPVSPIKGAK